MTRINKVLEIMAKHSVDSVIIKDVTTIRYLTGFTGDSSLLYFDRQHGVLITDGRYTEQAKNELKHFEVLEYQPTDANSIWAAAAKLARNSQVVGFDGAYYSYNDYMTLHILLGETYMQSIDFSNIRMVKDKKELDYLLKAASIADEAFIKILDDVVGESDSWQQDIYDIVLQAQLKGLNAAQAGMTGRELDAIVRDYITECGYGDYYVHGTGHGVGLEIHEMPNINKRGETILRTGMIFTIEPGIYIPGKGGVRIEDTVVLTEDGARALNGVKKQLIEIV